MEHSVEGEAAQKISNLLTKLIVSGETSTKALSYCV
jgi:hypothetical protein